MEDNKSVECPPNICVVGVRGEEIVVMIPRNVFSKRAALNYAAWLVALADDNDEFPAILEAVKNS